MPRLALIQQPASPDKAANVARGLANVDEAARQGANIVAFAELAFERFHPRIPADQRPHDVTDLAEPIPGPTTVAFQQKAAEHGIVIIINLFERVTIPEGPDHGASAGKTLAYDTSPVIGADGTLLGITRMVHITDYDWFHEAGYYAPGDTGMPVYETRFGRIGVSICYDRHFPESMRALALNGAERVIIPQAGAVDEWPDGLYEAELRVAAFQNGYFTALCNRVGKEGTDDEGETIEAATAEAEADEAASEDANHGEIEFAGESFICTPSGEVLTRAGTGTEEILLADLDLKQVHESHARKLFLPDRRPELYGGWLT